MIPSISSSGIVNSAQTTFLNKVKGNIPFSATLNTSSKISCPYTCSRTRCQGKGAWSKRQLLLCWIQWKYKWVSYVRHFAFIDWQLLRSNLATQTSIPHVPSFLWEWGSCICGVHSHRYPSIVFLYIRDSQEKDALPKMLFFKPQDWQLEYLGGLQLQRVSSGQKAEPSACQSAKGI